MSSPEPSAARSTSPADDEPSFPQVPRSEVQGPPSIISSRMTDIASDDGGEHEVPKGRHSPRKSVLASDSSRPGTARTGMSSLRNPWAQSQQLRRGLSAKRGSVGASSIAGSTMSGRPQSSTSRSHVPSLTSHAFFHPMSSQKLQAQRGASRPVTMTQPPPANIEEDDSREGHTADATHDSGTEKPDPMKRLRHLSDQSAAQPPPSRGSEMTEQETLDRITANTSPTHGHYPAGSLSESVRPLQKKTAESRGLSVRVDKSYKSSGNLPTPIKSPRSFRSSFLLPNKGDSSQAGAKRNMQGGEKLDSVASSPQLSPSDANAPAKTKTDSVALKIGKNFEYFEGNTVFCLGGRFQNTRSRPVNIATGIFVLIPNVLFFVFSAPWLWNNISPAIPLVFAYISFICISSFFHASVSDPGVRTPPIFSLSPVPLVGPLGHFKTNRTPPLDITPESTPVSSTGSERGPAEARPSH